MTFQQRRDRDEKEAQRYKERYRVRKRRLELINKGEINISKAERDYLIYKTKYMEFDGEFDAMLLPKFHGVYERTLPEDSEEKRTRVELREGKERDAEKFLSFREEARRKREEYNEKQQRALKEREEKIKSELVENKMKNQEREENQETSRVNEPRIEEAMEIMEDVDNVKNYYCHFQCIDLLYLYMYVAH